MGARERLAAEPDVESQALARHLGEVGRPLHVRQLTHVEVAPAGDLHVPEEDVARCLHELLPVDDALAGAALAALREVVLERRAPGLLELEEQRVVAVPAQVERDERGEAHAADADDLVRDVHERVPRVELPVITA